VGLSGERLATRRKGPVIAVHRQRLARGITEIGLRRAGGVPDIAGVTLVNDDPGGVAVDDILYSRTLLLG